MSRSTGYCRFPDGTIKYFLYDGTVSYVRANLYDSRRKHGSKSSTSSGRPKRITTCKRSNSLSTTGMG